MSLVRLLNQGRLTRHKTSKKEIANLIQLAKRDIKDAKLKGLSSDRKFSCAYNAVLQLATALLYCNGYKTKGIGHHITVFEAMKEILGKDYYELADYFDSCRAKRNITDYDYAGGISQGETEELIKEAESFLKIILRWLEMNYPDFI